MAEKVRDRGASISERVNKDKTVTFTVSFRIDGATRRESFGGNNGRPASENEKAANRFKESVHTHGGREARIMLERSRHTSADTPTFKEFAQRYLDPDSGMLTGIEPYTRHNYQRYVDQSLNPILGEYPIDAIDKTLIGKWVTWQEGQVATRGLRKGQPVSAKTVKNRHGLLSSILQAAADGGLRAGNPAYRTRLSKGLKDEAVFLSVQEYNAVHEAIQPRWKPLLAFLVGSQCRISEALALTWGDINRDSTPPTVRISKAWKRNPDGADVIGPPKTEKGRRTIAVWPALVAELGKPGRARDLIFTNPDGTKIDRRTFDRALKRAATNSGINQSPRIHDLRHTGVSWLIADGVPLTFIQHRLGHEKITTTSDTYGHLLPDAHTRMSGSLEAIMAPLKAIEEAH